MQFSEIVSLALAQFGDGIQVRDKVEAGDPWIEVPVYELIAVARWLRDTPGLDFSYLHSICCVDYCAAEGKKLVGDPRLEVVYHLSSFSQRHQLTLKVILPRWRDNEVGKLPLCPTVSNIWVTADWHERELFDLSGVSFTGHPNLRRILCPEDWVGHPLRKDYVMPREYHGIRGR